MKFNTGNEFRNNTTKYKYSIIDCYKNSKYEFCYMLKDQWCKYSAPIPVNEKDLIANYTIVKPIVSEIKEKVEEMKPFIDDKIVYVKINNTLTNEKRRCIEKQLSTDWNTTVRVLSHNMGLQSVDVIKSKEDKARNAIEHLLKKYGYENVGIIG